MRRIFRFLRWFCQDWWKPITNGKKWGVYHPWDRHVWSYHMTFDEAKRECDKRNE